MKAGTLIPTVCSYWKQIIFQRQGSKRGFHAKELKFCKENSLLRLNLTLPPTNDRSRQTFWADDYW